MNKTQGRKLIALLKQRPMTTMELLQTGISTCPWKRIRESLQEGEELTSYKSYQKGLNGINVYRVTKAYKPQTKWVK
jgi:hypothetical protein